MTLCLFELCFLFQDDSHGRERSERGDRDRGDRGDRGERVDRGDRDRDRERGGDRRRPRNAQH